MVSLQSWHLSKRWCKNGAIIWIHIWNSVNLDAFWCVDNMFVCMSKERRQSAEVNFHLNHRTLGRLFWADTTEQKKNLQNCLHQSTNVSDNLFLLIKSSEEPFWQQSWRLQIFFIRQSRKVKALFQGEHTGPHKSLSNSCITHPVPRMSIVIYCLIQNSIQSQLKSGGWHQEVQPLRLFKQDLLKEGLQTWTFCCPFFTIFYFDLCLCVSLPSHLLEFWSLPWL